MGQTHSLSRATSADRAADFRGLLEPGAIRAVFQPIVRLSDLEPIGYEGLARFPSPPGLVALPPDVTLAAAARSGLRDDLEVACWAAMTGAGEPPHGRLLFVNVAPDALGHPGLSELAERLPSRLVIELTEQDAVQDIRRIQERLRPWIARGALIAVDDAGAGFTSLEYVAEIRPDFLKLCRGMVTGVDLDDSRQAVLRATVAFAREVGARVVAEGVERPEELAVLRAAEVDFGQGWLFGRPGVAWPPEPESSGRRLAVAPGGGRLERAVASAETVRDACTVVVEHLARTGLMPSVYLEQGGRLRCQAVRGYWQIYDGMPAGAGVIGHTFQTGETTDIVDTSADPHFLPSVPSVVAELCVPMRNGDRVIGVLNCESPTLLGDDARWEIDRCADLLARRIGELGGPEARVAPAQRLARAVARLAALQDPEDIVRETVRSALHVAGFESAMIALADGSGSLYVHHAEGPFAVALDAARGLRPGRHRRLGHPRHLLLHRQRGVRPRVRRPRAGPPRGRRLARRAPARRRGRADRHPRARRPHPAPPLHRARRAARAARLPGRQRPADGRRRARAARARRARSADRARPSRRLLRGAARPARQRSVRRAARRPRRLQEPQRHARSRGGRRRPARDGRPAALGVADRRPRVQDRRRRVRAGLRVRRRGRLPSGSASQLRSQAPERIGSTLSVGLALAQDGESDEAMVARADAALYEAKRSGKNAVSLAPRA